MCHLILLLPIAGLPLLWLLPPEAGIAAYALVLLISAAVYLAVMRAMRRPLQIGVRTLLHATGTVRRVDGRDAQIWIRSELWSAEATGDALAVGDSVEVVAINGLRLRVRKVIEPSRVAVASRDPVAPGVQ
jgi:membrane protein implicated in regulation of membrane protease activity